MEMRGPFNFPSFNTDRLFRITFDFLQLKFNEFVSRESENYFIWITLAYGGGILLFMHQSDEPSWLDVWIVFILLISIAVLLSELFRSYVLSLILVALAFGGLAVKTQIWMVHHPILLAKTGDISLTGMVRNVEDFGDDAYRVRISVDPGSTDTNLFDTLLFDTLKSRDPIDVRLWIRGYDYQSRPGDVIQLKARLFPPPGPKVPGGFDFARRAYFEGLSAVGFAVAPPQLKPTLDSHSSQGFQIQLSRFRQHLSNRIRNVLPAQSGALIDALMTGNRADLEKDLLTSIRTTGLAHILAISGFHMGLVAGTIFWSVRGVLAMMPFLALRISIRRLAAILALTGAIFYLLVSGASVATQRAFCMLSIFFLGMFFYRPAIT
ncbi:MAG: ComEC/Rec2 family competence protein, partial [Methyloligellaceae bacterium]